MFLLLLFVLVLKLLLFLLVLKMVLFNVIGNRGRHITIYSTSGNLHMKDASINMKNGHGPVVVCVCLCVCVLVFGFYLRGFLVFGLI